MISESLKKAVGNFFKFLESNENENTISQNLWNTGKVVVRGKITVVSSKI
jgi:hypothetical protein